MRPLAADAQPQSGGRRAGVPIAVAAAAVLALIAGLGGTSPTAPSDAAAASAMHVASGSATTTKSAYELLSRSASKGPLRWPACRPIDYRINAADMPAGMDAVVKRTMTSIGTQAGVRFHYAGRTKRTFATTSRPSTPTIYFSFTHKRKAYGQVFAWPGEIGVGGPAAAWASDGDGHVYEAITSGRVLLSTTFRGPREGAGATWQSLIVHEVGHALNLAHRKNRGDAMYPELTSRSPGRFAKDEVAALKRVLQRSGCDYTAWSQL